MQWPLSKWYVMFASYSCLKLRLSSRCLSIGAYPKLYGPAPLPIGTYYGTGTGISMTLSMPRLSEGFGPPNRISVDGPSVVPS